MIIFYCRYVYSVEDGRLKVATAYPGLTAVASVDDGVTWSTVTDSVIPAPGPGHQLLLATRLVLLPDLIPIGYLKCTSTDSTLP